ncbi:MAG: hypothetical protein AAFX99_34080, partial [Myxococcota bacterium]
QTTPERNDTGIPPDTNVPPDTTPVNTSDVGGLGHAGVIDTGTLDTLRVGVAVSVGDAAGVCGILSCVVPTA